MNFGPGGLCLAWALDAAIGDPRWIPWAHPVVWVGRLSLAIEGRLFKPDSTAREMVLRGTAYWFLVLSFVLISSWLLLEAAFLLGTFAGLICSVYLAYACLATRCLDVEAREVARALRKGRLEQARERLSGIVGRDTDSLTEGEIVRATVETVAENSCDGVVAPIFYLTLGAMLGLGPLLGIAYKTVNTMDSMVGYRNPRYEHFGKADFRSENTSFR